MENFEVHHFVATALDPLHIGTGGQRLGRVDLTVVRESVTGVPKIPGTSLSGALKFYLDLAMRCNGEKSEICASTAGNFLKNHNRSQCPVCTLFGFTTKELSAQGIAQFSDGVLLAYPVNTLTGPVWITTAPRLNSLCGIGNGVDDINDEYAPVSPTVFAKNPLGKALNFGWVLLKQSEGHSHDYLSELVSTGIEQKYAERMVIVSEWIFAQLVNSNMEVRTSVVIDPETGAASQKGLFTYEAVARGALFCLDITVNDYNSCWAGVSSVSTPMDVLRRAFPGLRSVGMGGMTSRGFGRLALEELGKKEA